MLDSIDLSILPISSIFRSFYVFVVYVFPSDPDGAEMPNSDPKSPKQQAGKRCGSFVRGFLEDLWSCF